jgi:phage terminase large subunit
MYKPAQDLTNITTFLRRTASENGISKYYMGFDDPSQKTLHLELSRNFPMEQNFEKDIMDGIYVMRSLMYQQRIAVHPSCENFIRERNTFSFKKQNISYIEVPEDRNNHAMDAARYSLGSYIKMYPNIFGSLDRKAEKDVSFSDDFWDKRRSKKKENDVYKMML